MEHQETSSSKSSMQENVLERIRTDAVTQVSKSHFVVRMIFTISVAIVTLLVSISIFNFMFFSLRFHQHEMLLGFGSRGLLFFFVLFPWGLLIVDVLLVSLLEWLLRQFRFGYRIPILYLLGILLALTVSTGLFLDRVTSLNDNLLGQADHHKLPPPLNDLFEAMRVPPPPEDGVCKCVITAIDGKKVTAYNQDLGTSTQYNVTLPDNDGDDLPLKVGDTVFIAGDANNGTIRAFGMKRFKGALPPHVTPTEDVQETTTQ